MYRLCSRFQRKDGSQRYVFRLPDTGVQFIFHQLIWFVLADFLACEGILSPDNEENPHLLLESPLFEFAVPKQPYTGQCKAEHTLGMPMQDPPQNSQAFRNLAMNHSNLMQIHLGQQKENQSHCYKVRTFERSTLADVC